MSSCLVTVASSHCLLMLLVSGVAPGNGDVVVGWWCVWFGSDPIPNLKFTRGFILPPVFL